MAKTTSKKSESKSKLADMIDPSIPITQIKIDDLIMPLRFLEREDSEKYIRELAMSIMENGLINPITVKKVKSKYRILAGAHRYLAIQDIGWETIPCRITKVTNAGELMMALSENINRRDVNPLDIAKLIYDLQVQGKLTQEEVGERFGKSQTWINHKLSLLSVPEETQIKVKAGELSESHAVEIARLPTKELQTEALGIVEARGMNVKRTRGLVDEFEEHQTLHPEVKAHEAFEAVVEEEAKPIMLECAFDKHDHLLSESINVRLCPEHFELLKNVLMKDGIEFHRI